MLAENQTGNCSSVHENNFCNDWASVWLGIAQEASNFRLFIMDYLPQYKHSRGGEDFLIHLLLSGLKILCRESTINEHNFVNFKCLETAKMLPKMQRHALWLKNWWNQAEGAVRLSQGKTLLAVKFNFKGIQLNVSYSAMLSESANCDHCGLGSHGNFQGIALQKGLCHERKPVWTGKVGISPLGYQWWKPEGDNFRGPRCKKIDHSFWQTLDTWHN